MSKESKYEAINLMDALVKIVIPLAIVFMVGSVVIGTISFLAKANF